MESNSEVIFEDSELVDVGPLPNVKQDTLKKRKSVFRFNITHDVELLKEIAVVLPFCAEHGQVSAKWSAVADACGKKYDGERAQKRFQNLMSVFKNKQVDSLKKSGTQEEYSELDQLLQDLTDRLDDFTLLKKSKKDKVANQNLETERAEKVREAAMSAMSQIPKKGMIEVRKRTSSNSLLEIILQNTENKRLKLDLESRRLDLEERRVLIEEKRREDALAERKLLIEALKK